MSLESLARPSCPVCGRVAGAWCSVPLCQACRRRLSRLPLPQRQVALALAHLSPAPPARAAVPEAQITLF